MSEEVKVVVEGTENTEAGAGEAGKVGSDTFTKAEVDAMILAETDRRVASALKKREDANNEAIRIEKERIEAEKKGELNELVEKYSKRITELETSNKSYDEILSSQYEKMVADIPEPVKALIDLAGGVTVKDKMDFFNKKEIQDLLPFKTKETKTSGPEINKTNGNLKKTNGDEDVMFPMLHKKQK